MAKQKTKKKTKKKKPVYIKRGTYVTGTLKAVNIGTATKKVSHNIGSFAGLTFRVKMKKDGTLNLMTPSDMSQEISASWAEHKVIGNKIPKTEFLGPNCRSFSMTIVVNRLWGHSPLSVINKLAKFCEKGKVGVLKIGSHKIGTKWKIDSISQTWDAVYHEGQLVKATLNLTLSQYR